MRVRISLKHPEFSIERTIFGPIWTVSTTVQRSVPPRHHGLGRYLILESHVVVTATFGFPHGPRERSISHLIINMVENLTSPNGGSWDSAKLMMTFILTPRRG